MEANRAGGVKQNHFRSDWKSLLCSEHQKELKHYCFECRKPICLKCLQQHSTCDGLHYIDEEYTMILKSVSESICDTLAEKNERKKESFQISLNILDTEKGNIINARNTISVFCDKIRNLADNIANHIVPVMDERIICVERKRLRLGENFQKHLNSINNLGLKCEEIQKICNHRIKEGHMKVSLLYNFKIFCENYSVNEDQHKKFNNHGFMQSLIKFINQQTIGFSEIAIDFYRDFRKSINSQYMQEDDKQWIEQIIESTINSFSKLQEQ